MSATRDVTRDVFKDYVRKLHDDDVKYLARRLYNRMGGDLRDVVEFIGDNDDIDAVLRDASNGPEFFGLVDKFDVVLQQEASRRRIVIYEQAQQGRHEGR